MSKKKEPIEILKEHQNMNAYKLSAEEKRIQKEIEKLIAQKQSIAKKKNQGIRDKQALAVIGAFYNATKKSMVEEDINSQAFDDFVISSTERKLFKTLVDKDREAANQRKEAVIAQKTNTTIPTGVIDNGDISEEVKPEKKATQEQIDKIEKLSVNKSLEITDIDSSINPKHLEELTEEQADDLIRELEEYES